MSNTKPTALESLLRGGSCQVPASVATCPECGSSLTVNCSEWNSQTGIPTQFGFDVDCFEEELSLDDWIWNDADNRDFREVSHKHWQSDWQPIMDAVLKWIQSQSPPPNPPPNTINRDD